MIAWLDRNRALILQFSLRYSFFRRVFFARPERLLIFFVGSMLFNLFLAERWPLWALLLGPLILGIPHLGATIRYVPRLIAKSESQIPRYFRFSIAVIIVSVGFFRIAFGTTSNHLELGLALVSAAILGKFLQVGGRRLATVIAINLGLVGLGVVWPLETIGVLILGHNLVAFAYWFLRAKSKNDQKVALFASVVFILITGLILFGVLDALALGRSSEILRWNFDELSLGEGLLPHASSIWWSRAVTAYAFGQGMHYFVWLKAIPEHELNFSHPVSFSRSLRFLQKELGTILPVAFGILSVALLGLLGFLNLSQVRDIYLAGAAFHGYFEIAGLGFVRKPLVTTQ